MDNMDFLHKYISYNISLFRIVCLKIKVFGINFSSTPMMITTFQIYQLGSHLICGHFLILIKKYLAFLFNFKFIPYGVTKCQVLQHHLKIMQGTPWCLTFIPCPITIININYTLSYLIWWPEPQLGQAKQGLAHGAKTHSSML